jgi:Flp pilus assembly protein TadB
MEVLAMGLHVRERRKLRQLEEALRKEDPGLDTLLAGWPPPGRSALRHNTAVLWAIYLVPPALIALGLVLHVMALVVAGAVAAPLVPVIAWSLIRRRFPSRRHDHLRRL